MKRWVIILFIVIVIVLIVAVIGYVGFIKKGSTGSFEFGDTDYSKGGNVVKSLESSTKSNAFEEVETNPFRYGENG